MAEVRWSQEAERWLREIHDHIAQDNPDAAVRTVRGIYEKAELLAEYPELGYRYRGRSDRSIRILLYGHDRIAYLIHDSGVTLLGIFHGALDIERYL